MASIRLDLLEILGDGYIAQHISQQAQQEAADLRYKTYVTDALFCICRGRLSRRWIESERELQADLDRGPDRSAGQIIADLKGRINGEEDTTE